MYIYIYICVCNIHLMKNVSQNTAYVFFLVDCSSLALYFAKDISMAGGFLDHFDTMQLLKEEYIYICMYI